MLKKKFLGAMELCLFFYCAHYINAVQSIGRAGEQ